MGWGEKLQLTFNELIYAKGKANASVVYRVYVIKFIFVRMYIISTLQIRWQNIIFIEL
jgi:hypothetical protein